MFVRPHITSALYEDDCLYVVPRSQTVVSTPEQRALSMTKATPDDPMLMPGSIQVKLKCTCSSPKISPLHERRAHQKMHLLIRNSG